MEGKLICLIIFKCVCMWTRICQGMYIKIRWKLMGISFLLPLGCSLRLNSGLEAGAFTSWATLSPYPCSVSLEPAFPVETPRKLQIWREGENKKYQGPPTVGKTVGPVGLSLRIIARSQSPWSMHKELNSFHSGCCMTSWLLNIRFLKTNLGRCVHCFSNGRAVAYIYVWIV